MIGGSAICAWSPFCEEVNRFGDNNRIHRGILPSAEPPNCGQATSSDKSISGSWELAQTNARPGEPTFEDFRKHPLPTAESNFKGKENGRTCVERFFSHGVNFCRVVSVRRNAGAKCACVPPYTLHQHRRKFREKIQWRPDRTEKPC